MQVFEQKSDDFLPFYGNISMSKIFLPRFKALRLGYFCVFCVITRFLLWHFWHYWHFCMVFWTY